MYLLIVTAITTQALQIAGIMDSPKSLGLINYPEQNQYDYQLAVVNNEVRDKRQTGATEERSKFIDSLFNVSNLLIIS